MEKLTKDLFSEKDNKIAELEKKLRKVGDFCHWANIFKFILLQRLLINNYFSLICFLHTFPNLFRPWEYFYVNYLLARKLTFKIRICDGFLSCLVQVQSGAKELQTALDHKNKDIAQCKAQLEYQCLGRKFLRSPVQGLAGVSVPR